MLKVYYRRSSTGCKNAWQTCTHVVKDNEFSLHGILQIFLAQIARSFGKDFYFDEFKFLNGFMDGVPVICDQNFKPVLI